MTLLGYCVVLLGSYGYIRYILFYYFLSMILRDFMTNWMSACEIIDSDNFLGAENSYNLFTVIKDSFTIFKEEGTRLQVINVLFLQMFGVYYVQITTSFSLQEFLA